jgi:hypothetical protein
MGLVVPDLVLAAGHELDGLDVEDIAPVGLVLKGAFEHRLGLTEGPVELDDSVDLVRDDGIEDHSFER